MNNNQVTERALRNVFSVPNYITFGSKECVARHAAAGAGRRRGSAARGVRCPAGDTGKKNKWEGGGRARCGASARHPLARGMPAPAPMPHPADLRGERPVKRRGRGGRGACKPPPARRARGCARACARSFSFVFGGGTRVLEAALSAPPRWRCVAQPRPAPRGKCARSAGRAERPRRRSRRPPLPVSEVRPPLRTQDDLPRGLPHAALRAAPLSPARGRPPRRARVAERVLTTRLATRLPLSLLCTCSPNHQSTRSAPLTYGKPEKDRSNFGGKQFLTTPTKAGRGNDAYFDRTHPWISKGDKYSDRLRFADSQKEKKKGFGTGDFMRRSEYTNTIRTEQYREQLKEELRHISDNAGEGEEVQAELEAEMMRLTKKADVRKQDANTELYDLVYETKDSDAGYFGSSKQARDTKNPTLLGTKRHLGIYKTSAQMYGENIAVTEHSKPDFARVQVLKSTFYRPTSIPFAVKEDS